MNRCPRCGHAASAAGCAGCGFRPARVAGFPAFAPELAHADSGYDSAHFARLAPLEAANFWFRARNRLILHLLARHAPETTRDYLEIGCGTGYVLEAVAARFAHWRLSASDVLGDGLAFAAARVPSASLFQMDARRMPFDATFDIIGAYDVLEHIDDDERVLTEIQRALRPGGMALLAVPQHPWLWSAQDRDAQHVRRYRRGELEEKLQRAGFRVCWSGSYLSLLLPMMAFSRLWPARADGHDAYAELQLPRWLDHVLEAVMRIEGRLVAWGARFAAGGSRMVVATRIEASR